MAPFFSSVVGAGEEGDRVDEHVASLSNPVESIFRSASPELCLHACRDRRHVDAGLPSPTPRCGVPQRGICLALPERSAVDFHVFVR